MRAKSRWAVIVLGLGAGMIVSPLCAQQKPSILETIGGMFGKDSPPPAATPRPSGRASSVFSKPGNATARGELKPAKPAANSGSNSGGFFSSFNGLDTILGTTANKSYGESAEGIEAPPPPTLEPSEPSPSASTAKTLPPTNKPATLLTRTPSIDLGSRTSLRPNEPTTPSAVVQKATSSPLAAASSTSSTATRTSSRRGWQSGERHEYVGPEDTLPSASGATGASMKHSDLIDRRLDAAEESDEPVGKERQTRTGLDAGLGNKPPPPMVQGRAQPVVKVLPPLEGRDRLSQAARLGGAVVRVKTMGETPVETSQNEPSVQAASYDLPPILTPEEARAQRAARGK